MHWLDGAGKPAAIERQLALDHGIAVVEDMSLEAGERHHQRLGLMWWHLSEALRLLAKVLHPKGAVGVQHDLDDVRLCKPRQNLVSQFALQFLSKPLGGFGARTHRPRPCCSGPLCCRAGSPSL